MAMRRKKGNKKEVLEKIARLEEELFELRDQLSWENMTSSGKIMAVAIDDRSFRTNIEQVLTGALDAVVGANHLGRIIFWNHRAEEIFGWKKSEVRGKPMLETMIPRQYREAYQRGWRNLIKSGGESSETKSETSILNKRLSMTALRKSGEEFPVEVSVVPIGQGENHFFSAFIQDISERKKVIDNLKEAKEASEKANQAKDEFIAQVSHEIRTPLNGIYGMLQLALDTELTEEQEDYLVTAKRSAEVLTGIVDDILDFSKIESGQLSLVDEPFDLHESVAEVVQLFSFNARKKGLVISHEVDPAIPHILIGDWNRIRQIFLNLIGNALKFTDKGMISVTVSLEEESENPASDCIALRCEVTDTGIGIPDDKKNSIFEAFIQADSSVSRNYGGTGLGLTIAHKLVELMEGWIWLESKEGEGSKFSFVIKLQKPAYASETVSPKASSILRDISVLVVDEEPMSRKVLSLMLESWQMRVRTVTSNPSAISELLNAYGKGTPFSMAIVDAGSRELEGLDLVSQIRNDPKFFDMPLLLLSQDKTPKIQLDVSQMDIMHVVAKPVSESKLLAALIDLIEHYPQLREKIYSSTTSQSAESRKLKILIAEDDKVNQKIVSLLLGRRGHSSKIVENGQDVLRELSNNTYDAIIMDLQMPTMDGITATKLIRAQEEETGNHVSIIASTAYATKDEREKFIEAGVDDYISKPFSASELFRKLEEVCSREKGDLIEASRGKALVNKEFVKELFQNDRELIREAAQTFIDTLPEYKKQLRQSTGEVGLSNLKAATHQIRGAVGNLGATDVVNQIEELEIAADKKNFPETDKLVQGLILQLEKVSLELSELSKNED